MSGSIEDFAANALEMPDSFYTSSEQAYVTHGVVAGITRDSDILDQSNWSVWLKELGVTKVEDVRPPTGNPCGMGTYTHDYLDPDNDDVFVMGSSHWACGWIDTLMVRVYRLDYDPTAETNDEVDLYTPAFLKAYEMRRELESYPVFDDEDYSQREHDDLIDTLVNCYNVPQDGAHDCAAYLYENGDVCRSDDIGSYTEQTIFDWFNLSDEEAPDWLTSRFIPDYAREDA